MTPTAGPPETSLGLSLHLLGALPSAGEKEPERLPQHLFLSVPHPRQASSPPSPGEVVHSDHRLFLWERQPRCLVLTEHEFHFLWCIWFLLKVCSPVCPVLRGCSRVRARVRGLSRPLSRGPLPFPPLPAPTLGSKLCAGHPVLPSPLSLSFLTRVLKPVALPLFCSPGHRGSERLSLARGHTARD